MLLLKELYSFPLPDNLHNLLQKLISTHVTQQQLAAETNFKLKPMIHHYLLDETAQNKTTSQDTLPTSTCPSPNQQHPERKFRSLYIMYISTSHHPCLAMHPPLVPHIVCRNECPHIYHIGPSVVQNFHFEGTTQLHEPMFPGYIDQSIPGSNVHSPETDVLVHNYGNEKELR